MPEASGAALPDGLAPARKAPRWRAPLAQASLPVALLALLLGFSAFDARVVSPGNLVNILQQSTYLAIFSMAQMVVILTRGFDLALGPSVSMTSVTVALAMAGAATGAHGEVLTVALGLATGLLCGAAVGAFNGLVVAFLRVTPFVTTLGSYNIALGLATTLSGGRPVQGVPPLYSHLLYASAPFGLPASILIATVLALLLHLALRRTVFGRSLYLVGGNARAAALAGLPTRRIVVGAYMLSALLTAIGAMMLTARTWSGEPNLGGSLSLQAVAAAVIGGVSLAGGSGGVGQAVLGALFVTVLSNGMDLTGIDGYVQMIVLGLMVILGVVLDQIRVRRG